ncbi:hypothetical protein ACWGXJ_02815 [Paenibacillus sp. S33]|uniref:hypothetical protein n=1 Tax=Paenibacillus TaxID=44249 RepID=UPI00096D0A46|nr:MULTISPECIES: hypothetical protein [Paenibacillus]OMF48630.1 hypothetical protein BK135_10070 [Paenibacillus peoriae]WDM22607.1 hypothetical protein J4I02_03015 [Paenibacillus polymyxa]
MLYIKTEIDGKIREIEIFGDEIFTRCFKCGKEFQVDDEIQREILKDEGSFCGISLSCGCNTEKPTLIRIK